MSKDVKIIRGNPRIGCVFNEYDLIVTHPDIAPFIINIKTRETKDLECNLRTDTTKKNV